MLNKKNKLMYNYIYIIIKTSNIIKESNQIYKIKIINL